MASVEELTQLLKADCNGDNLFDHLTDTLLELLVQRPEDPLQAFDTVSTKIRQSKVDVEVPSKPDVHADHKQKMLEYAHSVSNLLKKPDEPLEDTSSFADLLSDVPLMRWAGVHFGEEESYHLALSIRQFANSLNQPDLNLRFWGRVQALNGFYYVLEGANFAEQEEEANPKEQEGKQGLNRFAYWVSMSAVGPWLPLPNVTRAQVVLSRSIRRLLTGQLDAPVLSYPPFPGQEKHLLRTLIARISSSTSVSPSGFFAVNEEEGEAPSFERVTDMEQLEARDSKSLDVLSSLDGWTHHTLEVNVKGRTLALPEEVDEEGNAIEEEDPPEVIAPLRSLAEDKEQSWATRVCPNGAGRSSSSSVVVLRSLVWPGAFAVADSSKFVNVYVGDGMKHLREPFSLSPPLPIQSEWCSNQEELDAFQESKEESKGEEGEEGEGPSMVFPKLLTESVDVITDPTPVEETEE
jgi:radial spoke head protein 4A